MKTRLRFYTGPTTSDEVAAKLAEELPDGEVLAGTEHVHVTIESGPLNGVEGAKWNLGVVMERAGLWRPDPDKVHVIRSEAQRTPGPWEAVRVNARRSEIREGLMHVVITHVPGTNPGTVEADARLISDAPKLQDTIKGIYDICGWYERGEIDAEEAFNQIGKLAHAALQRED